MIETKTGRLSVPGASLYYQARGLGPILLTIAAGAGDAEFPGRHAGFVEYPQEFARRLSEVLAG